MRLKRDCILTKLVSDADYTEIEIYIRGCFLLYVQLKMSLLSDIAALLFDYFSTLKMEAKYSSEKSNRFRTTRCYNHGNRNHDIHIAVTTSCPALIIALFWDMTPCNLVECYQSFG